MRIYPAIDLKEGQCVRLMRGDFEQKTVYKVKPAVQAEIYKGAGCDWVHIVDLDGALTGRSVNLAAVKAIIDSGLKIQLGGGIRSPDQARYWWEVGVSRVVIGTWAVQQPEAVKILSRDNPGRVALGLDARGRHLSVQGWTKDTDIAVLDMAREFDDCGLGAFIYTNIARDGVGIGPEIVGTALLSASVKTPVIASGGIGKVDDIVDLMVLEDKIRDPNTAFSSILEGISAESKMENGAGKNREAFVVIAHLVAQARKSGIGNVDKLLATLPPEFINMGRNVERMAGKIVDLFSDMGHLPPLDGVIVGRALYDKKFTINQALAAVGDRDLANGHTNDYK